MEVSNMNEQKVSPWQATTIIFFRLFREKLMQATKQTERNRVHPPKDMTTEALLMIVLMAIFITLSILGSLSTTYEFLYEENTGRKKLDKNSNSKNIVNTFYEKDWISNSRSFLHCFCFLRNGKKIFQANSDRYGFECFHGIKTISNLPVIWGHIAVFDSYTRSVKLSPYLQKLMPWFMNNVIFTVDAFLVLSGFLNSYSFSKEYIQNNGKIRWCNFYLKRFIRITPMYMIVFGFNTFLHSYTGSGPLWPEYETNPICSENWWRYFLYINNFQLGEDSCMPWCWYLAIDMQFYVVSPIFLLFLLKCQRFGILLTSLTIFLSSLASFLVTKQYNLIHCSLGKVYFNIDDLEITLNGYSNYLDMVYYKPYTRIGPYIIGLLLGYYFSCKNFEVIRNRWVNIFGWIAAGIMVGISFFPIHMREESLTETALYNSVKHLFFSIGLTWIIIVCITDQRSFTNAFLSWKLFYPLSKLSLCVYLIHMIIMQRDYQAAEDVKEYSILSMVLYYLQVVFWSYVISIPTSLLFEMPPINVYNVYTRKKRIEKREERKKKI